MILTTEELLKDQIKRINNMKTKNSFLDFLKDIKDEQRESK